MDDAHKDELAQIIADTHPLMSDTPHPTCPLDHTPNEQTIKALQDASEGHRLTSYASFEDWIAAILADGEDDEDDSLLYETGDEVTREIDTLLGITDADKHDDWDRQMIADSKAGRLDHLIREAEDNYAKGDYEVVTDGLKRPLLKPPKTKEEAKAQIKQNKK